MTKIKTTLLLILAAMLIIFVCTGARLATYAQADEEQAVELPEEQTSIDGIAEQFTDYLKAKYGDEYEYYYNEIIEQWGSVEGYLLAFGDKLPEQHKTSWDKFVGWLGDYSPVWAPALAVIIVIIVAVVGKKAFNKSIERIVNSKLSPIVKELNLQSNATATIIRAQRALLGNNERFANAVEELTEAEKELKNE